MDLYRISEKDRNCRLPEGASVNEYAVAYASSLIPVRIALTDKEPKEVLNLCLDGSNGSKLAILAGKDHICDFLQALGISEIPEFPSGRAKEFALLKGKEILCIEKAPDSGGHCELLGLGIETRVKKEK